MLSGKGERLLTGPATVAVILLLFWLALAASLRDKSLTYDEGPFAVAGCSYWRLGDYRLSPETGLLPQRVAGLPLALGHYKFPAVESSDWRNARLPTLAYDWFYQLGNNAEQMAAAGRAACGLFAVTLGAVVWAWSRKLFGPRGGMVSLMLYVLNPAILANGALMTSDTAAALFFLAASWGWWAMLHRMSAGRLLGSALLAGGLFVSKMSAVLIIPVVLALATARLFDGRPLPVAFGRWRREISSRTGQAIAFAIAGIVHVAVIVAVIWSLSGFRFSAFADPAAGGRFLLPWEYALNQSDPSALHGHPQLSPPDQAIDFLRRHELLPEGWLYGFAYVLRRAEARPAFWNGECSQTGWPGFFPYAFLVKTPLGVFGVCGLALAAGWMSWKAKAHSVRGAWRQFYATLPLWVLPAVYWAAAISSHLNIGHRHLLPVYAPMFVLCGAAASWLGGKRRAGAALCGLLALLAAESFWFFPNYLAYFNGIVRPSEAYRHLVDSSLDWGQELPAARRYIEQHPEEGPFYLSYFGMASPAYHRVAARLLYSFGVPHMRDNPDLRVTKLPPGRVGGEMARLRREQTTYDLMGVAQIGSDAYAISLKKPAELRLAAGTYLVSATMLQPVYYSGPWGPWNQRYEAIYRRLQGELQPLLTLDSSDRAKAFKRYDLDTLGSLLDQFQQYRLARLTAYLRQRRPDATLNYAILVYRLTDADLVRALE